MKFTEFDLAPALLEELSKNKFTDSTTIQADSFKDIVSGGDVAGLAQTGSGKTLAYAIPVVDRIIRTINADEAYKDRMYDSWNKQAFVLILVPTRELAEQVRENVEMIASDLKTATVYGGVPHKKQIEDIKAGADFVIATPGRLIDLFKDHVIDLGQVRTVVFDEADRLFDMGFSDDICYVLDRIPRERQFLAFSATLNLQVLQTCYEYGSDPKEIGEKGDSLKAPDVNDEIFHISRSEKPKYLYSILKKHNPKQVIVFSNLKKNVERISNFLNLNDFPSEAISSLISQDRRNKIIEKFKNSGELKVLVGTDLAARGLDIRNVDLVINYDLPSDAATYVHRIGRTGRAGDKGKAFGLVCEFDVEPLDRIQELLGEKIEIGWMDDEDLINPPKRFPSESPRNKSYNNYKDRKDKRNTKSSGGGRSSNKKPGDRRYKERDGKKEESNKKKNFKRGDGPAKSAGAANSNTSPAKRKNSKNAHKKKRTAARSKNSRTRTSKNTSRGASTVQSNSIGSKIKGFLQGMFK